MRKFWAHLEGIEGGSSEVVEKRNVPNVNKKHQEPPSTISLCQELVAEKLSAAIEVRLLPVCG